MIKDKITPELKKKILEEIKLNGESCKERFRMYDMYWN